MKEYADYLMDEQERLANSVKVERGHALIKGHCRWCKKEFWMTEKMAEAVQEGAEEERCEGCSTDTTGDV